MPKTACRGSPSGSRNRRRRRTAPSRSGLAARGYRFADGWRAPRPRTPPARRAAAPALWPDWQSLLGRLDEVEQLPAQPQKFRVLAGRQLIARPRQVDLELDADPAR